jgi:hypothetical protein
MTDIGLISVLPVGFFVALALLTCSFCLTLRGSAIRGPLLLLHVGILILVLYGTPALVEQTPRIAVTWRHLGLIDFVMRSGKVLPRFDAYFNWPGFFVLGALFSQIAGVSNLVGLASWSNVFFNLLYLAPLAMIYRSATRDHRLIWLGLWFFYLTNWVGQDYLSPQGFDYFLYLAVLGILLGYFSTNSPSVVPSATLTRMFNKRLPRLTRLTAVAPAGTLSPKVRPLTRVGLMAIVIGIFAAMIPTHQLTPFAALASVTALVVFNRISPRGLPVLMAVMVLAWMSYGAMAYFAGHLEPLVTSVGSLGRNVNRGVVGRLRGSPGHELVVHARLLMAAIVASLAMAGFIRRFMSGHRDLSIALVAGAPTFLLVAQYGGEMFLRVYFYCLPGLAFLTAALFCGGERAAVPGIGFMVPARIRRTLLPLTSKIRSIVSTLPSSKLWSSWRSTVLIGLASLALTCGFLLTRYGNERMDYFTLDEVQATRYLYGVAPSGSIFVAPGISEPWQYERYTSIRTEWMNNQIVRNNDIPRLEQMLVSHPAGGYVLITRSAVATLELYGGVPNQQITSFEQALDDSPHFVKIYENPDALVYKYIGPTKRGHQ